MSLVLGRKEGESIDVDGPARFVVESISGNRVKVRIVAPDSTRVLRTEIVECKPRLKKSLSETMEKSGTSRTT